jgi:hypothetical protein
MSPLKNNLIFVSMNFRMAAPSGPSMQPMNNNNVGFGQTSERSPDMPPSSRRMPGGGQCK